MIDKEMDFRSFINESEELEKDVKTTISRLPKAHQKLVKPFKLSFEAGNTLKGDNQHIGCVDEKNKKITVAAPWNYSKEFVILHEFGHIIFKYLVTPEKRKEWSKIVAKTKEKVKDNDEEVFSHAYACAYCNKPVSIHDHPEWERFIKSLPG